MNEPISDPSHWMHRLGMEARRHRKLAGLTQRELAQLADVGKTVVFDLEKGKDTMQVDTVLKILGVLNIRLDLKLPTDEEEHA